MTAPVLSRFTVTRTVYTDPAGELTADVEFTAHLSSNLVQADLPEDIELLLRPVWGRLEDGVLVGPDNTPGVDLLATDDLAIEDGFSYTATFHQPAINGTRLPAGQLPSVRFNALEGGETFDLKDAATVVVTGSGVPTTRGPRGFGVTDAEQVEPGVVQFYDENDTPIGEPFTLPGSTWSGMAGKPAVIASGATQAEARTSIGAAAAADIPTIPAAPTWSTITGKPAVVASGANAAEARTAIGAVTAADIPAAPNWGNISGKPAVVASGADAATARATISALGAGDLPAAPTWGTIGGKPAVVSAGATAADARTAIGAAPELVPLGSLFKPMTTVLPSGIVTTDEYVTTASTDFTNGWGTLWSSGLLNSQGMNWVPVIPGNNAAGCSNHSNGRYVTISGTDYPQASVHDFEFIFTGQKLDIMFQGFGAFDSQVYVEHEGLMCKIRALPLTGTYEGHAYRKIRFAEYGTRRIRVILPSLYFVQLVHEQSAIVKPSPDRPLLVTTGDSYFDGTGGFNSGSNRSFHTFSIIDEIMERTGFAIARCGQGGTGWFNSGAGAATDTEVGSAHTSRFFSTFRQSKYSLFLGSTAKPIAFLINGTINDGELSGGGVASQSAMATRVTAGLNWIASQDSKVRIIPIGPEPINDSQGGGVHATNRLGIIDAANAHAQVAGFADANHPTKAYWTGTGYDDSPATSQQARMVGHDQIHTQWYGQRHYGRMISADISTMLVGRDRAERRA